MPKLKNAILSLPREDRAAFMYAYQHSPQTVKRETPPSRFEGLPSGDPKAGEDAALALAAAARLCNYWKYKWILFYSDEEGGSSNGGGERRAEPSTPHGHVEANRISATDGDGAPDAAAATRISGPSLFLQLTRLSHLTEQARHALASGYLAILPDVTVLLPSETGPGSIQSCPVVCFDSTKLSRQQYDSTSYLQATFYFWNMLCQERWQQQDEQEQGQQAHQEGQGAVSLGLDNDPAFAVVASSTHYVGLILIDPETVLDDTVQAWVDMTLSCVPMHAHSLHVLACTSTAAAPISPYDMPNIASSAHFYVVVLPRTIKVVGKLMREKEVHIHVRSDAREFAPLLHETHGIPPSVLPARVGGTLCELSLWRSRLVHQASLEGTSDFLPPVGLPSSDLPSFDAPAVSMTCTSPEPTTPGALPLYLDEKMDRADGEDDVGKGLAVSHFSWDDETSHAGFHNHEEHDIVDSLLYFHGSEAAPASPAPHTFFGAPENLKMPADESMGQPTASASTPPTRTISIEDAVQLAHAEDMVGKGDGVVLDLAALDDALHAAPSLVTSETPWDLFLAWTQCAHRPALGLLSCWWRLRREWFGPKAWLKPMTQTGEGALSRKEVSFLRSSECIQWLPVDSLGRSVLYLDIVEALTHASRENMDFLVVLRCVYYALYVVASDHSGRQRQRSSASASKSAVIVVSPDRSPPVPFESFLETHYSVCGAMKQLWGFFPMSLDGIHLLPAATTATPNHNPDHHLHHRLSHPRHRAGVYELFGVVPMHRSCCAPSLLVWHERPDTLSQHGLALSNLPTSVGGAFGRLQFSQWLELRVRHEWSVPAGTRNKALLDMFDFSHVKPLCGLRGADLAERKRRMNNLHTRRKRDREHQEELQSRDQISALSSDNDRLRADNDHLETILESSRLEMSRQGLPDPSSMKPSPQPVERKPPGDALPPREDEVVPQEPASDPSTSSSASAASAYNATVVSNDGGARVAEQTKSRNRLYSQRKRDKDRTTLETLSRRVEVLTAQNQALRADQCELEDRLHAALWEVSQRDPFF